MEWTELAFLHWRVDAKALRQHLPAGLELETFDGSAWLGVVPFRMRNTRHRCGPRIPTAHTFPELNVRTYVRAGGRSGVWFFSLDAASRLAVEGARITFGLPYFAARMQCVAHQERVEYASERADRRGPIAQFAASWSTRGDYRPAAAGTLEHFLTERYCLFTVKRGVILRGDIAHEPWHCAPLDIQLGACDMTRVVGLTLDKPPDSTLMARAISVVAWWPCAV